MKETQRFAAFISYSHRDAKWAAWLQRALERYRLPAQVAREANLDRRIGSVFRDREELTAGANLGEHLLNALARSDALIVICSPNAIRSQWVGAEIEHFKSLGKAHRIFCLLVDGGAEAFPEPLLTDTEGNALEPLAADPRDHADGKRLARLKLIAGLLDLRLDQLARRDLQRQRQLRAVYLTLGMLFAAVSLGAYWNWQQQQQEAQKSLELVRFVSGKWDELRKVGLPLDLMVELAEEPLSYLKERGAGSLDADGLESFALLLRQLGIAYMDQEGGWEDSLTVFKQSREIYLRLSDYSPNDTRLQYERGLAQFWVGANRLYWGDYENALAPIQAYSETMGALAKLLPDNETYARENVDRQTMLLELKRSASQLLPELQLEDLLAQTIASAEETIARFPESLDILEAHMTALIFAKRIHNEACKVNRALPLAEAALASARKRVELELRRYERSGIETRKDLASLESEVGHAYAAVGRPADARRGFLTAYALRSNIAIEDPTNQYLNHMVFANGLDLFRLDFLTSRETPPSSVEAQILDDMARTAASDKDLPANSKAAWHQSRAEKALTSNELTEADLALQKFKTLIPKIDNDLVKMHYEWHAYWLTAAITPNDANPIPQNPEDIGLADLEQSCMGREISWSWYLANDRTTEATAIARSLWDKGYRRPRMAFYATLAGTSYPPEGVTTP